jgi:RNA polymerase sigma-70 factor (ECF subfamily)
MSDEGEFEEFLRRIRAGDQQAAVELVRRYEPVVRLEVRLRLRERRLRRVFDSMDVCQSVLATFFARAAAGQFALKESRDLVRLLVVIARNKLALQVRRLLGPTRDPGPLAEGDPAVWEPADPDPGPEEVAANQDLIRAVRDRLSEEEQRVLELRGQNVGWAEVAAEMGGTAQARRKQLERALERVLGELGLEEEAL